MAELNGQVCCDRRSNISPLKCACVAAGQGSCNQAGFAGCKEKLHSGQWDALRVWQPPLRARARTERSSPCSTGMPSAASADPSSSPSFATHLPGMRAALLVLLPLERSCKRVPLGERMHPSANVWLGMHTKYPQAFVHTRAMQHEVLLKVPGAALHALV